MEYRILGLLEVSNESGPIRITAAKHRALLDSSRFPRLLLDLGHLSFLSLDQFGQLFYRGVVSVTGLYRVAPLTQHLELLLESVGDPYPHADIRLFGQVIDEDHGLDNGTCMDLRRPRR